MENVRNPMQVAIDALKSGTDIETAVYGTPGNSVSTPVAPRVSEEKPEIQISEGGDEPQSSPVAEAVSEDQPSTPKKAVAAKTKETTPPADKKLKDFEQGMRKFQVERDRLKAELDQLKSSSLKEYEELKSHWSNLEKAYATDGFQGVMNLIAGDEKAFDGFIQKEYERRKMREEASPQQRERMDLEERLAKLERDRQLAEKRASDLENNVKVERQQIEVKQAQSVVTPVFEKYRFSGKLGDETAEYYYDKAIWNEAMEAINQLPKEEVTQEEIEAEFKKVANAYRSVIKSQVDNKTKKVIETKKQAAQQNAAIKAMSGMATSGSVESFKKDIHSGNLQGAFRQLLSGKIKLS
jgi:hypothetical protein